MNLLIVDDEVISVKGMMDGIDWKACGITNVWTAYSAQTALRIFGAQQIDVFLCDIEMPGANGIELLRTIRKDKNDVACIFLTCHANFEYAQEAISLGCSEYILKPVNYEEITQQIKNVCVKIKQQKKKDELSKYQIEEKNTQDIFETPTDGRKENKSPKEIVELIETYIVGHMKDSELLVSDIADKLFLNKDYLNRIFKKEKGMSISQYLIQERMNLASLLLQDTKNSVNDVAEKVGYNNYPYFASSFKRYHGCSPSQYQKQFEK